VPWRLERLSLLFQHAFGQQRLVCMWSVEDVGAFAGGGAHETAKKHRRRPTREGQALNPGAEHVATFDRRQSEIERLAYALWQNAGEPSGTADRDWFLAEHVLETGTISLAKPPGA
jgi:hypothetical protein